MSSRNTNQKSPSSSPPLQETKTKTPLKENPLKRVISKGKAKTMDDLDHEEDDFDFQMVTGEINEFGETPVGKKTFENPRKTETLEQELREEDKVDNLAVQGEINAVKETPLEEIPTGETETKEEDNVEALFLQIRLNEIKEKRCTPLCRIFQDSDEQRLQEGNQLKEDGPEEQYCEKRQQRSQEQVHQTLPPSGFDFQHLNVLQDIPLSSFYGVDFDNVHLPIQPSSHVGSFYGLDTESLAAENAALDEFYAKRGCKKSGRENDQFSGNQCSEDQNRDLLYPQSTSEESDDILTLTHLFGYKFYHGPLPYVVDKPATTLGAQHPLLVYINSKLHRGCISESQLTAKVLKLQTKYKKLVAEKGKTPKEQHFSTGDDFEFFQLLRMVWSDPII